jgi:hypothetical protein
MYPLKIFLHQEFFHYQLDKNGLFFESYRFCKLNKTDSLKKTLAKVGVLEPKSNYSQENNYGIEKPGFKSVEIFDGVSSTGLPAK